MSCRKFGSASPGRCWKCGAELVKVDDDQEKPKTLTLRLRGQAPVEEPRHLVLRLRGGPRILFVGCIDGGPELEFLKYVTWPSCTAHFTAYKEAPKTLLPFNGKRLTRPEHTVQIVVESNIDATKLDEHYPPGSFDAVVWIGPTFDGQLPRTPELVGWFVKSAGKILVDGGVVFVVQDLKTPNFRGIINLPGAIFCCELAFEGRTKTQHSTTIKKLERRTDQLIAFTFWRGGVGRMLTLDNKKFEELFSRIMSVPNKEWPKPYQRKNGETVKPMTKQQIAALIFDFAKDTE